tara:strand:- start:651 stop:992 length:342 start_codon:yes stop_codon:yes gene_type:complete
MLVNGFVYILRCADGKLYVGSHKGDDVATRVAQHNAGHNPGAWTFKRRPVALAWSAHFDRIDEAFVFERQIKKWSRAKKEALIAGDVAELKRLAVSKSAPANPSKPRKFPRYD